MERHESNQSLFSIGPMSFGGAFYRIFAQMTQFNTELMNKYNQYKIELAKLMGGLGSYEGKGLFQAILQFGLNAAKKAGQVIKNEASGYLGQAIGSGIGVAGSVGSFGFGFKQSQAISKELDDAKDFRSALDETPTAERVDCARLDLTDHQIDTRMSEMANGQIDDFKATNSESPEIQKYINGEAARVLRAEHETEEQITGGPKAETRYLKARAAVEGKIERLHGEGGRIDQRVNSQIMMAGSVGQVVGSSVQSKVSMDKAEAQEEAGKQQTFQETQKQVTQSIEQQTQEIGQRATAAQQEADAEARAFANIIQARAG